MTALMTGLLIITAIGLPFLIYSYLSFKKTLDDAESMKTKVDTDPSYALERKARTRLKESSFGSYKDVDVRIKNCAMFIKDGAFMVSTNNALGENISSSADQTIYVHTANGIVGRVRDNEILRTPLKFAIERQVTENTYMYDTPKKSVIGSAAAGAVIGGAAGAVVGAVYAADKNATSSKTVSTQYGCFYYIKLNDPSRPNDFLDYIMISKKASSYCPQQFIKRETDKYWLIKTPFCYNKSELEGLLSYLNGILTRQYKSV